MKGHLCYYEKMTRLNHLCNSSQCLLKRERQTEGFLQRWIVSFWSDMLGGKKIEIKVELRWLWDCANQWVSSPAVRGTEGEPGAFHRYSPASIEESNNKLFLPFEADPVTFLPSLRGSPLHCPSASHKSWSASTHVPLKFRNVRLGFEALVSYRNTWERQRKGGQEGERGWSTVIPMKGHMVTANEADELVLGLSYLRCGRNAFRSWNRHGMWGRTHLLSFVYEVDTEERYAVTLEEMEGIADDSGPAERRAEGYKNRTWLGRGLAWLCLYCTASTHSFGPRARMHQAACHCLSRVTALCRSCLTVTAKACLNLCSRLCWPPVMSHARIIVLSVWQQLWKPH